MRSQNKQSRHLDSPRADYFNRDGETRYPVYRSTSKPPVGERSEHPKSHYQLNPIATITCVVNPLPHLHPIIQRAINRSLECKPLVTDKHSWQRLLSPTLGSFSSYVGGVLGPEENRMLQAIHSHGIHACNAYTSWGISGHTVRKSLDAAPIIFHTSLPCRTRSRYYRPYTTLPSTWYMSTRSPPVRHGTRLLYHLGGTRGLIIFTQRIGSAG